MSRAANVGARHRVRHLFHALQNNFAVVEVRRGGAGRWETAFHVHAWDGRRAPHAYTVRCLPDRRGAVVESRARVGVV